MTSKRSKTSNDAPERVVDAGLLAEFSQVVAGRVGPEASLAETEAAARLLVDELRRRHLEMWLSREDAKQPGVELCAATNEGSTGSTSTMNLDLGANKEERNG